MRAVLPTLFVALLPLAAAGQGTPPAKPQPRPAQPPTVSGDRNEASDQESNLPEEMRIRMAIERADGEHRKILEDVKKMSELTDEVSTAYGDRAQLSPDDVKKLSTIEKLAKRVLTHAGGSEVDDKSHDTESLSLGDAFHHMCAAVSRIKNDMTEQTRHIVSAVVIASSNEVITMTHLIRRKQKKD
ncbi:MAG TPA: hypothetical protein VGV87_31045 [Blastocatellia bacterium]|jgi:hypothetical protein|nr:hypothetical protein [Blastocatellia bacterium]